MNCREASIQISLHVGDDLPQVEVPMLEEHLEHCAVCQVEYESYASARDALQLLQGELVASTTLWGDLEAQLDTVAPALGSGRNWARRPLWTALAAVLLLAVSAQFWFPTRHTLENAVNSGNAAMQDLNVGLGLPDVGPKALVEDGPQSEQAPYEDIFEILKGPGEQTLSEDDLQNPMIAAPASRRSF
jgi:hypothetical protein